MKKIIIVISLILTLFYLNGRDVKLKIIDKDLEIPLEGVKVFYDTDKIAMTDTEGKVIINISEDRKQLGILTVLPGYSQKKTTIKDFEKETLIIMVIEGVIEGKELVVSEQKVQEKQEVSTSFVIDKEEIDIMGKRGEIQDVISSVKTLPGISYTGSFYTDLSVRGGDSYEIAALWDGFVIRYPYYWGGSHTIFNPNIVKNIKFYNGIFPADYGLSMSGLMQINTITPNEGFKMFIDHSMSSIEGYFQIPMGKFSGLLLGARCTYLELTYGNILKASGAEVPVAPYIRDGFIKWYFKPNEKFEWFVNGFFGGDGIQNYFPSIIKNDVNENGIKKDIELVSRSGFAYSQLHGIGMTGFNAMPSDKVLIKYILGYEYDNVNNQGISTIKGDVKFDSDIKNKYPDFFTSGDKEYFNVDLTNKTNYINLIHSAQTKLDVEFQLHDKVSLNIGLGLIYDYLKMKTELTLQNYFYGGMINYNNIDVMVYQKRTQNLDISSEDKNYFIPSTYINLNFTPVPNVLEMKLGARLDYYAYIIGGKYLATIPFPNPRFYLSYTPIKDEKIIKKLNITFGCGLYSNMPAFYYQKDYPAGNFSIKPNKMFNAVTGFSLELPLNFKIVAEGYFKYYFDKYYYESIINTDMNTEFKHHNDGVGYVGGFDISLEKSFGKYIDGRISYSFIYARFLNPSKDENPLDKTELNTTYQGEPVGIWYYPKYHRFHTLNVVLNIKPASWITISPNFTFATGLPMRTFTKEGPYPAMFDGQKGEIYTFKSDYSDDKRTNFSVPLGLKISFNGFFPKSKVEIRAYIAIDNIVSFFYMPETGSYITNQFTGDITPINENYTYNYPTFGFTILF